MFPAVKKAKLYLPTPSFPRLNDKLLNTKEAACLLGLSTQTLYKQKSVEPDRLPAPIGSKFWQFDLLFALEVERLIRSGLSKLDALAQAEINVRAEILGITPITPLSTPSPLRRGPGRPPKGTGRKDR